jgi:hypothetical protein
MLLALGVIGIGAVLGWSLSNYHWSRRNALVSLITLAAIAMETRVIFNEVSISVLSAATVAGFGVRSLVWGILGAREAARL